MSAAGTGTTAFIRALSLTLRHAYFEGGRPRGLACALDPGAQAFLRSCGVRVLSSPEGLALAAEERALAALWDRRLDGEGRPRLLEVAVLSSDPLALVYTAPSPVPPVFGPDFGADGTLLRGDQPAPPAGRRPGPAPAGSGLPLARVLLPLVPPGCGDARAWRRAMPAAYGLGLESRSTVWSYILTGDWSAHRPRAVDLGGSTAFADPSPLTLDNGAPALALRSLAPLPLEERPTQRLQLRDAAFSPERVLIRRLPTASPARFNRAPADSGAALVSEIYIHR